MAGRTLSFVRSARVGRGPQYARFAAEASVKGAQMRPLGLRVGAAECAYGILPVMSAESTAPNLVELVRVIFEAVNRRDWDAVLSFYAPDAVWDASPQGVGTFEGADAIRGLWNDWVSSYEEWEMELDEVLGFGHGIVFAARHEAARPIGGEGYVKSRGVYVYEWIDGMIARVWYYPDIDEARVVAEHLAEERG